MAGRLFLFSRFRYYYSKFGLRGVAQAAGVRLGLASALHRVELEGLPAPLYLRLRSSDVPTFEQVFEHQEYDFEVVHEPRVIVDAGANIGLASIWFASRFPDATIIAIEPEASNFELLKRNVAAWPNVIPLQAALWHRNEEISLLDPGYGHWGFMTESSQAEGGIQVAVRHTVEALTLDRLMERFDLETIDILKVDIEGAEKEVFSDTSAWIERVEAIIIELHERMKDGCNRSFYSATAGFRDEWSLGENIYLSRGNCLARRLPQATGTRELAPIRY